MHREQVQYRSFFFINVKRDKYCEPIQSNQERNRLNKSPARTDGIEFKSDASLLYGLKIYLVINLKCGLMVRPHEARLAVLVAANCCCIMILQLANNLDNFDSGEVKQCSSNTSRQPRMDDNMEYNYSKYGQCFLVIFHQNTFYV